MNLKSKSNSELINETLLRREREKEFVAEFLHYLKEIEERGLHLERGFSSLYGFCTEFLGYSKDEAHIRIQAMRLLRALPETEDKIKAGTLTLSSAARIQGAFKREDQRRKTKKLTKLSLKEKKEIVLTLESQSSRECERALAEIFPESQVAQERTKPLANEQTLIQFVADNEMMRDLERLKGLLAHKNFDGRWDLLFKELSKIALDKLAPERKKPREREPCAEKRAERGAAVKKVEAEPKVQKPVCAKSVSQPEQLTQAQAQAQAQPQAQPQLQPQLQPQQQTRPQQPTPKSLGTCRVAKRRYLSVHVTRDVQRRAGYACEYVDPLTGRRCNSRHALEIDHIVPIALGGGNEPENLRVLCAAHNKFLGWKVWREKFGRAWV